MGCLAWIGLLLWGFAPLVLGFFVLGKQARSPDWWRGKSLWWLVLVALAPFVVGAGGMFLMLGLKVILGHIGDDGIWTSGAIFLTLLRAMGPFLFVGPGGAISLALLAIVFYRRRSNGPRSPREANTYKNGGE